MPTPEDEDLGRQILKSLHDHIVDFGVFNVLAAANNGTMPPVGNPIDLGVVLVFEDKLSEYVEDLNRYWEPA
jgi:hypothetical protein